MRILVVDDDSLAAEMTAAVVTSQNHAAIIALNAMDAVEQLERYPDTALIVSDLYMPLISGLELNAMLKEQGVELPFVLLTGDTTREALTQTPGIYACLQKDARLATTLSDTLHHALGD